MLGANTPAEPARLFVTQSDAGVEVVVEGLPVEIQLPNGLLGPLRSEQEEQLGPRARRRRRRPARSKPATYDTFEVVLSEQRSSLAAASTCGCGSPRRAKSSSSRRCRSRSGRAVSAGCRADGVHDLGFLPYPTLSGRAHEHELALEWARHEHPRGARHRGHWAHHRAHARPRPLARSAASGSSSDRRAASDSPSGRRCLEFVLEDLALPVSSWLTPVATHGRFGLRRAVLGLGDEAEPYDMSARADRRSTSAAWSTGG